MTDITSILLSTFVAALALACGPSIYDLPAPPSDDERRTVSLDPTERRQADGEAYVAARATTLALYQALSNEDWSTAWDLLSNETRLLLDTGSNGRGVEALAEGRIALEGNTWAFDPVEVFLLPGMVRFDDQVEGEAENETARRKEIWVADRDGNQRRVVVIREGDLWRVHVPRVPVERMQRVEP